MNQSLELSRNLTLWHLTPSQNVAQILKQGLEPRLGPRSRLMAERVKAVYFFPDCASLQDALANWYGEELEGQPISLIEVVIPRDWVIKSPQIYWELRSVRVIPPHHVRLLIENLDEWDGQYPEDNAPDVWINGPAW